MQRIIIAGGSISGLTLALALQSAKIDFLILESGDEIGPQLGASVGCHPHGNNIFQQLDAYKNIRDYGIPLAGAQSFDGEGNLLEPNISVISQHTNRWISP